MTLSRRDLLRHGAAAGALAMTAGRATPAAGTAVRAVAPPETLPSPGALLEDFGRMVDFGPRLTGTPAHERFIDWVQDELERAGCVMYPRDDQPFTYWNAERVGLDVLDGDRPGPVALSSYFPRSGETPAAGITGRLVPATRPDLIRGNIVLVESALPPALTEGLFIGLSAGYHWPGHAPDALRDYKRVWLATLGPDALLQTYQGLGAAGAVFVLDASVEAAAGAYVPFNTGFFSCPAVWVDRDTGAQLARAARTDPPTMRLTLTAEKRRTTSPSIVGVLPGDSDEVLVVNTHTDGQNAFEENAAVTLVHLARHFAAQPAGRRLSRSLVFSAVTGHMTQELPQTQGFVDDHPDLVAAAAAGLTIEHLGSTEWVDDSRGFHATGDPEMCGLWCSQSGVFDPVRRSLSLDDIPHTYLLRPQPLYLGIGEALYDAGIPGASFIAGPSHLVNIAPNGHIDKLDADLAARQTRWLANLLTTFDGLSAKTMMAGDSALLRPKLGRHRPFPAPRARCLPRGTHLRRGAAGPVGLGDTRADLRAAPVRPDTTRRDVLRYCVDRARGRVTAIVDGDQVRALVSTLPTDRPPLARSGQRTRVSPGLFRVSRGRFVGVRGGSVRFTVAADPAARKDVALLRRLLRRGGFRP